MNISGCLSLDNLPHPHPITHMFSASLSLSLSYSRIFVLTNFDFLSPPVGSRMSFPVVPPAAVLQPWPLHVAVRHLCVSQLLLIFTR